MKFKTLLASSLAVIASIAGAQVDYSSPTSISLVVSEADMITATGQSSIDYRTVFGGPGNIIYTYTDTGSDSGADPALVEIDFTGVSPAITVIGTETQILPGFTQGQTDIEANGLVEIGGVYYIAQFTNNDEIVAFDPAGPTSTSLLVADGLAGIAVAPNGTDLLAWYHEGFGAGAGTSRVDQVTPAGVVTTLVNVSAATAITGEANFGPENLVVASNGDLLIWDENFRSVGTGSDLLAFNGTTVSLRKDGDTYESGTGTWPQAAGMGIGSDDVIFQFSEFADGGGTPGLFITEGAGSGTTHILSRSDISLAIDGGGSYTYGSASNIAVYNDGTSSTTAYLADDNNGTIIAITWEAPGLGVSEWNLYE